MMASKTVGKSRVTYPVDLVQVARLEHHRADDTGAARRLHLDLDLAVEEVPVGRHRRPVAELRDAKAPAFGSGINTAGCGRPVAGQALGEVDGVVSLIEARVVRAFLCKEMLV